MYIHTQALLLPANGRHGNRVIGDPACTKLLAKREVELKADHLSDVPHCASFVILANAQVTAAARRANSKRLADVKYMQRTILNINSNNNHYESIFEPSLRAM